MLTPSDCIMSKFMGEAYAESNSKLEMDLNKNRSIRI